MAKYHTHSAQSLTTATNSLAAAANNLTKDNLVTEVSSLTAATSKLRKDVICWTMAESDSWKNYLSNTTDGDGFGERYIRRVEYSRSELFIT